MLKMQNPVLTDTEAETSIDLDATAVELQHQVDATNATKSVFNITLENLSQPHTSLEFKNYEDRLQKELKEWRSLWRDSIQKLKALKREPHPTIDCSILPAEKREHLERVPDMQNFIRGSVDFRQMAHVFIERDYAEIETMQKCLIEASEYRANVVKANGMATYLAERGTQTRGTA